MLIYKSHTLKLVSSYLINSLKDIGTLYLISILLSWLLGITFLVLIRLELSGPGVQYIADNQVYNSLITAHAILIILSTIMPALIEGFAYFLLPLLLRVYGYIYIKFIFIINNMHIILLLLPFVWFIFNCLDMNYFLTNLNLDLNGQDNSSFETLNMYDPVREAHAQNIADGVYSNTNAGGGSPQPEGGGPSQPEGTNIPPEDNISDVKDTTRLANYLTSRQGRNFRGTSIVLPCPFNSTSRLDPESLDANRICAHIYKEHPGFFTKDPARTMINEKLINVITDLNKNYIGWPPK